MGAEGWEDPHGTPVKSPRAAATRRCGETRSRFSSGLEARRSAPETERAFTSCASPPNKRLAEREGAGQTEDGGDPQDQSSRIRCSWRGPTQHRSLQGPPRAEPACTGLLSRGGELLFWVLAESPPLCEVLLVPSASASLSQTARRAGPALVLLGAHSGSGRPRHAGCTRQPPALLGASPLLIRANVPERALPAWPFPTPLHGGSLGSPLGFCLQPGGVLRGGGWPGVALWGRRVATTETRGRGSRNPSVVPPPGLAAATAGPHPDPHTEACRAWLQSKMETEEQNRVFLQSRDAPRSQANTRRANGGRGRPDLV